MGDYKELKVWQKAHAVALEIHELAGRIRGSDNVSLRSQLTRAAFSVPANIVEGNGVQSAKEYARFVRTAINSSTETEYHLGTARDLKLVAESKADRLSAKIIEVRKMLHGLLRYLENENAR